MVYEYKHHHLFGALAAVVVFASLSAYCFSVSAAAVLSAKDTVTREKKGTPAIHAVSVDVGSSPVTGTVTFDYSAFNTFGSFAAGTCTGGTVGVPTQVGGIVSVPLVTCTGATTFSFSATNPNWVGSALVSIGGAVTGHLAIPVMADDTITVSAAVDSSIAFAVGATNAICSSTFVPTNWTVDFGRLSTGRKIASSDDTWSDAVTHTKHICTILSTNATGGAVVSARNANGANGLQSASVGSDKIVSATGQIVNTAANYGMCYTVTRGYNAASVPPGNDVDISGSVFSNSGGNCTSSTASGAESVGGFTGADQQVWRVNGITDSAYATIFLKVAISGTEASHNDYQDAITFTATATF